MTQHAPDTELAILQPADVEITRDDFGSLCAKVAGAIFKGIKPVRSHPLTDPDRFVALMDKQGDEIGFLEDVRKLDRTSRNALNEELDLLYFHARVTAVYKVESRFGVSTWDLDTDRGRRTVHVKERSDVRPLSGGRIMITDVNGMKFDILDKNKLDEKSARLLDENL